MKQYFIIFSLIVTSIFSLSSCNDDNNSIRTTVFTLTTENPKDLTDPSVSNLTASFKNKSLDEIIRFIEKVLNVKMEKVKQ